MPGFSDIELAALLERGEIAVYDDFRFAPAEAGISVEHIGSTLIMRTLSAPQSFMMNRALGLGLDGPIEDALLQHIREAFLQAGLRNFGVQVAPALLTQEVEEQLANHGFKRRDEWLKLYREPVGSATGLLI